MKKTPTKQSFEKHQQFSTSFRTSTGWTKITTGYFEWIAGTVASSSFRAIPAVPQQKEDLSHEKKKRALLSILLVSLL